MEPLQRGCATATSTEARATAIASIVQIGIISPNCAVGKLSPQVGYEFKTYKNLFSLRS